MFYLGCHLSVSAGYLAMGECAKSIGANTFQYFTRNPRSSAHKKPDSGDVARLYEFLSENAFAPAMAHAPYTFNPASADERIWMYSCDCMREDMELLEALPGSLYNFHPGCHVGQGSEAGIARCAELLNRVIDENQKTTVLIETMSGKGSEIGATFEQIRSIIDLVSENKRRCVGVCLDTCHISDAGYDIAGDTESVLDEFDRVIGLSRLFGIHLNDSKNPLGSKKDRHEKIGEGSLGLDGIASVITSPRLAGLPFYLETPNDVDGYAREIALLRSIRTPDAL